MAKQASVTRTRSPRYPRISLEAAVAYAKRLYEGAHRSTVDMDTAVRVLGFAGSSGASNVAVGALRQYGLVDGLRGSVQISDLALKIFEPSSSQEQLDARMEAGHSPDVFNRVLEHFDNELPRSDEAIRSFLIRTLDFSKSGAQECINVLRRTLAELRSADLIEDVVTETLPRLATELQPPQSTRPALHKQHEISLVAPARNELVRIPLTRECTAELRFEGQLTEQAIAKLLAYINLMKDVWSEE